MKTENYGNLTRAIVLPFSGFYCSVWSDGIDRCDVCELENDRERDPADRVYPDNMEHADLSPILTNRQDYRAAMDAIARLYAAAFGRAFERATGHPLRAEFDSTESPRFYNFETDRIFARVRLADLARIREAIGEDVFRAYCADQFRPRSGFIPFSKYREGDVSRWPESLAEWDHNMLACIIGAALAATGDDAAHALEYEIYEGIACNGEFDNAWYSSIDWDAVRADVAEWREENEGAENDA